MEQHKTMTPEVQASILAKFESRANTQGLKGKKRKTAQTLFLIGAVSAIDSLLNNTKATCIPPGWMFDMMRGDYVTGE
jgi:hypothetical protein